MDPAQFKRKPEQHGNGMQSIPGFFVLRTPEAGVQLGGFSLPFTLL
jgi:hypothetical protein